MGKDSDGIGAAWRRRDRIVTTMTRLDIAMKRCAGWPHMVWSCVVALSLLGASALAAESIGVVAAAAGPAVVHRLDGGSTEPLAAGMPVFEGDRVVTGPGARLRLALADDTMLHIGSDTDLTLTEFAVDERGVLKGLLTMPAGIVRVIVDRLLPGAGFQLQAETAVTSVRGTDWITHADRRATAVVTLSGAVTVASTDAALGAPVVLTAGEGTTVPAGAPPQPKSDWGQARILAYRAATASP